MQTFLNGKVHLWGGDSREVLRSFGDASIDSVVCDPPYALVSIGKRYGKSNLEQPADKDLSRINGWSILAAGQGFYGADLGCWRNRIAVEFWEQVFRVLKPGGHVVAFSGTRTYHRLACAIEDAGFEIRDQLAWTFATGFPKSHNIARALDGVRCRCSTLSKCDVRPMQCANVSTPVNPSEKCGKALLKGLPQQGLPPAGRAQLSDNVRSTESSMEGGATYRHRRGNYVSVRYVRCPLEFKSMARTDGYVMDHRLVMAKWIRRPLTRTECVHHVDHRPLNNLRTNLELWPDNRSHKMAEHGKIAIGAANLWCPME